MQNMGKRRKGSATPEWHMVVSRGCSTPPAGPLGKALRAAAMFPDCPTPAAAREPGVRLRGVTRERSRYGPLDKMEGPAAVRKGCR